ncbi:MAG TPA: alkaline phosphatase family protein [Longimicrobiales bacterium]|nr:alkaline phosphatase family protein [Longimicrobiales bacterium]
MSRPLRLLILGLDCAAPEILLEDEDLPNVRRLMEAGRYGRLESVVPAITVPAWLCMSSSQDPGTLGLYGFRNRPDRSYGPFQTVDGSTARPPSLATQVASEGGRVVQVGVPPSYPPRRVAGAVVGCFLTPDTERGVFTHPPELSDRIRAQVGHYPVDVPDFRNVDRSVLRAQVLDMSRTQFRVFRTLLADEPWDLAHFVDIGLDRIQHAFWRHHDPAHPDHEPGGPWQDVVLDYYRHLDREIGQVLAQVPDDTVVLLASDHGAQALQGGICVNEWLIERGDLVLEEVPAAPTPLSELKVDWDRTRAWAAGGYYARIFLNVRGREPRGTIAPGEALAFREELARELAAIRGPNGEPLETRVFRPEEIYREVRGVPPDVLVYFDDMRWRSVGSVGWGSLHVRENDTGPDDCNHAPFGAFVLAAPGLPPAGEVAGMHLLDVAPTLLTLAGYEVPQSMQGRARFGVAASDDEASRDSRADRAAIRERLSGLGYLE